MIENFSYNMRKIAATNEDADFARWHHFDQQWTANSRNGNAMNWLTSSSQHDAHKITQNMKICGNKEQRIARVQFDRCGAVDCPPFFVSCHSFGDSFKELPPMSDGNHIDLREAKFVNDRLDHIGKIFSIELNDIGRKFFRHRMIARCDIDTRTLRAFCQRESKFTFGLSSHLGTKGPKQPPRILI